ncbi:MAG: amidohydrolase family protein [Clostridia bacterium]|nr:amidohydrolase family protein [Clostridia bacterium]
MQIIDMDAHPPFGAVDTAHLGILTPTLFFERLQKAGIAMAAGTLLLPSELQSVPLTEDTVCRVNDAALSIADTYPDQYIPGIHVSAAHPTVSCREIERYSRQRVCILGEIQSEWLADREYHDALLEIFSCAERYGMIVSMHPETPDHLRMWAGKFPSLKFMYGDRQCRTITPDQSVALLLEHPNLFLRLSQDIFLGNYYLHTYADRFPTGQILFGSGYPLCNPAARTAGCMWELRDQTEDIKRKIFHENAANCLSGGS